MDLPPRIAVAVLFDGPLPQDGLDGLRQRFPRPVARVEQLVGGLLANHQAEALEAVEELVKPQRKSPRRRDHFAERDWTGIQPREQAELAGRANQVQRLVGVKQHAE